jgi:hypothetical protein
MSENKYFRSRDVLWAFFNEEDLITVTGIRDFCRTRGIVLFAQERQGIPQFPAHLLYGVDSLRQLALYINAQPLAVAGFIVRQDKSQLIMSFIDLPLIELLDRVQDKELNEDGLKLHSLEATTTAIHGQVRYYRNVATVDMVPDRERIPEDASFFLKEINTDEWVVFVIMQKVRDFRAVLTAMQSILLRDSMLQWRLDYVSLDQFRDSEARHTIIEEFINRLSKTYECLGIMRFTGKRDFDVEPRRLFDAVKDVRQATLHQIFPIEKALEEVRQEGAYARSLQLILTRGQELFIVELKGEKDRVEVSVIGKKDIRGIASENLRSADDIKSLQTIYVTSEDRVRIANEIWRLFFGVLTEHAAQM